MEGNLAGLITFYVANNQVTFLLNFSLCFDYSCVCYIREVSDHWKQSCAIVLYRSYQQSISHACHHFLVGPSSLLHATVIAYSILTSKAFPGSQLYLPLLLEIPI